MTEENSLHDIEAPQWMLWKRRRYVVALLAFWGFFNIYALRANLSIAIVEMTADKTKTLPNGTTYTDADYKWNPQLKGLILSSFFYGYFTTQFVGGWWSAKIGGKRLFGLGVVVTATLTLLTPALTKISVYLLLTVRVLEGVFEGVTYPCIHAIWSRWAPPLERTKLATIAFSGSHIGSVISMPLSAYLATSLGWESIFYFFGCFGLVWYLLWWYFVTESPADDKRISDAELKFIQKSLGNVDARRNICHPWRKILTSAPVWAIVVAHFADNWGLYTLLTQLPTFMKDKFDYDLETTGLLSGTPYLVMAIMVVVSGQLADFLRKRKILSTTNVRKLFNCGAFLLHASLLVTTAFMTNIEETMICLLLAVGFGVFSWSGFGVNYLDIAPQHASIIMGLSNTVATIAGILSPTVTSFIVVSNSAEEWKIVFCVTGAIFVIGSILYGILASGEVQPWAVESIDNDHNKRSD